MKIKKVSITRSQHLEEILAVIGLVLLCTLTVLAFFLGRFLVVGSRPDGFLPDRGTPSGVFMIEDAQKALKRP
jgi:hypothetical protein